MAHCVFWRQVLRPFLETLISKEADIPAVTRQVLIALLLADQLDLKVLARMIGARRR
jgi:hypothetical protein